MTKNMIEAIKQRKEQDKKEYTLTEEQQAKLRELLPVLEMIAKQ